MAVACLLGILEAADAWNRQHMTFIAPSGEERTAAWQISHNTHSEAITSPRPADFTTIRLFLSGVACRCESQGT